MAKKNEVKKEVAQKVELKAYEGVKEFESNGKSKHMAKGLIFAITYAMAKIFITKGYGKIK